MIAGLGLPGLLWSGIQNATSKIPDKQPGQDSKLHQTPSFAGSATPGRSLGATFRGGQENEGGMRWDWGPSLFQTLVPDASGGDLTQHVLKPMNPRNRPFPLSASVPIL